MDNFDIKLIDDFKGYNSARDKTNIDKAFLVRGSKNVYKKISGTIATRPGLKRIGDADATVAGIKSDYVWNTSLGSEYVLRVQGETEAGNDAKLQVDIDGVQTDLLTGLSRTRFVFDSWLDVAEGKDKLIFVNGSADLMYWSGGVAPAALGTASAIFMFGNSASLTSLALGGTASNITKSYNSLIGTSAQAVLSLGVNPTNGQTLTFTINGTLVTVTFVTAIGAAAGNVLIGATAAVTRDNLIGLLRNPGTTSATQVALSGPNQTLIGYLTSIKSASIKKSDTSTTWAQDGFSISSSENTSNTTAMTIAGEIVDAGANFVSDGFKVGNYISINGSASNDGIYILQTVTPTVMIVTVPLVAEATGAKTTIREAHPIKNGATTYYYVGGENGDTLAIEGGNPASLVPSSQVVQAVETYANTPGENYSNDFIIVTPGNQLAVGSYDSRIVYLSDDTDFSNFVIPTPREPGDPAIINLNGLAKGMVIRKGNLYISFGTSGWLTQTFKQSVVNNVIVEDLEYETVDAAALTAAYAHEFIDTVGDDIVYLSQDQQVRVFGNFRNLTSPKFPSLSQAIQTELSDEDFTGGHLISIADFVYITAPIAGRDYMFQTREGVDELGNVVAERLWHPPQIRNISRFLAIDGLICGHSNANPQLYQVWDTGQWYDDSPSDEQLPYECVARLAYRHNGRRQGMTTFDKLYNEGYIANGVHLLANVYFEYQGSKGIQNVTINSITSPAKFFSGSNAPSLGDSSLGDNPLGDGLSPEENDQERLPKFRTINNINPIDCFEYEYELYSYEPNSRWELLATGVNEKLATTQATFIQK